MPTIRMSCTDLDNGQSPLAVQGLNDFLLAIIGGRGSDHIFHPKPRFDSKISQPHITAMTPLPRRFNIERLQINRCHLPPPHLSQMPFYPMTSESPAVALWVGHSTSGYHYGRRLYPPASRHADRTVRRAELRKA